MVTTQGFDVNNQRKEWSDELTHQIALEVMSWGGLLWLNDKMPFLEIKYGGTPKMNG